MLDFGFKHTTLTMPEFALLSYCKVKDNGVDSSGLGNSFTAISGSWALGTFVGTMPNSAAIKTAIGHVNGVADWAYGADDLPIAGLTQAVITANNNSFNFLVSSKGIAIYGSPDTLVTATQVRADRAMKLLPYNQPTAFFNGVDSSVSSRTTDNNGVYRSTADTATASFTGGPQWVPDNLGVLRLSPTDSMARQGMRVLATLADYAAAGVAPVYGSELWVASATVDGSWVKVSNTLFTNNGTDTYAQISCSTNCVLGKRYELKYQISNFVSGSVKGLFLAGTVYTERSGNNTFTEDIICESSGSGLRIQSRSTGFNGTVTIISFRELIPTYYDTALDGTPIVTSVNQATRTEASPGVFTPSSTLKRYNPANPLTMPGFLCEPARTNKCTCVKANPTATTNITTPSGGTVSVVDSSAALLAAKLEKVCTLGKAYTWDTAGTLKDCVIAGTAGNTNAHTVSAYVRVVSGTGGRIRLSGVGETLFTNTSFQLVSYTGTALTTSGLVIRGEVGSIIEFILPQLEEGAFCTSPIVGADTTASATRAATVLTYPTAGEIRSNNMAFRMIVVPMGIVVNDAVNQRILGAYYDSNNKFRIGSTGNAKRVSFYKSIVNIDYGTENTFVFQPGQPSEVIAIQSSSAGMLLTARQVSGSWSPVTQDTTAGGKANMIAPATFQIGALSSVEQFTGNISLFETLPIPQGITDPLAWAKEQWGIV